MILIMIRKFSGKGLDLDDDRFDLLTFVSHANVEELPSERVYICMISCVS